MEKCTVASPKFRLMQQGLKLVSLNIKYVKQQVYFAKNYTDCVGTYSGSSRTYKKFTIFVKLTKESTLSVAGRTVYVPICRLSI